MPDLFQGGLHDPMTRPTWTTYVSRGPRPECVAALVREGRVAEHSATDLKRAVRHSQGTALFDPAHNGQQLLRLDPGDRLRSDPREDIAFQLAKDPVCVTLRPGSNCLASHSRPPASTLSRVHCRFACFWAFR